MITVTVRRERYDPESDFARPNKGRLVAKYPRFVLVEFTVRGGTYRERFMLADILEVRSK